MKNLCKDPVFLDLFAQIGIDMKDVKDNKETQQTIYDIIEKQGNTDSEKDIWDNSEMQKCRALDILKTNL